MMTYPIRSEPVTPDTDHSGPLESDPPNRIRNDCRYILPVLGGECWFTEDGLITDRWEWRGIWRTPHAAALAAARFLSS